MTTNEDSKRQLETVYPYLSNEIKIALDMAIEALEKQIPKKPTFTKGNPYFNSYLKKNISNYWCPNCKCEVDEDRDSCCPSCGQRLEWEYD